MRKTWFLQGEALIESIRSLRLPESCVAIWRIGQCGFFFKYGDTIILVDPVLTPIADADGVPRTHYAPPFASDAGFPVDAVFCTHNHPDHLNPDTIRGILAAHPDIPVYLPKAVLPEIADLFRDYPGQAVGLRQNVPITAVSGISVTPVAAAHDHYETDASGNERALGYVFHFGRLNLFHAGDTLATDRLVGEVRAAGPVHAAFLPINGRDWIREKNGIIGNMTPQEAALFADRIGCGTVIPTHYDMILGNEENPLVFAYYMQEFYPERPYHLPALGEPYILCRQAV